MKDKKLFMQDSGAGNTPPPPPPTPPTNQPSDVTSSHGSVIEKMVGNMKFVGMFNIIVGIFECLGCITALIGVPLIFMGIRLRQSAESFSNYLKTKDSKDMENAIERLSRFIFISKVLAIIAIIIVILYAIFLIIGFSTGLLTDLVEELY